MFARYSVKPAHIKHIEIDILGPDATDEILASPLYSDIHGVLHQPHPSTNPTQPNPFHSLIKLTSWPLTNMLPQTIFSLSSTGQVFFGPRRFHPARSDMLHQWIASKFAFRKRIPLPPLGIVEINIQVNEMEYSWGYQGDQSDGTLAAAEWSAFSDPSSSPHLTKRLFLLLTLLKMTRDSFFLSSSCHFA